MFDEHHEAVKFVNPKSFLGASKLVRTLPPGPAQSTLPRSCFGMATDEGMVALLLQERLSVLQERLSAIAAPKIHRPRRSPTRRR
jgi:hypothetical protein